MEQLLPPIFIAIASLALCTGLYAAWQSLRALFAVRLEPHAVVARSERERLLAKKATLINALRELRTERDLGKISDQDFDALDARYRAQTKDVLRALDSQLGSFRKQAEQLLRGGGSEVDKGDRVDKVDAAASADDVGEAAIPAVDDHTTCSECGTRNDADAVFCKKCAHRLVDDHAVDKAGEAPDESDHVDDASDKPEAQG